jgi:hypothetical protein
VAVTYTDLMEVDLGKLGAAVATWKQAVSDLEEFAEDAHDGLKAKRERHRDP